MEYAIDPRYNVHPVTKPRRANIRKNNCGTRPTEDLLEAMRETEDILAGRIPSKRYTSVEELIADILAEDDED